MRSWSREVRELVTALKWAVFLLLLSLLHVCFITTCSPDIKQVLLNAFEKLFMELLH